MALTVDRDDAAINAPVLKKRAATEAFVASSPQERPAEGIFVLPGGYVDENGISHVEVELASLSGNEEEFLASVPPSAPSASVVTGLLTRCIKRIGALERIKASLVRDLLVGDRDYLILKLREMTLGEKLEAILHCPNSGCGKPMDITLLLDNIPVGRKTMAQRFFTVQLSPDAFQQNGERIDHRLVEFRLPTGSDQEALATMVSVNEARAIHQLLARCIRRIGDLTPIDEAAIAGLPARAQQEIEQKMQQLAPQVDIELEAICPACQTFFVAPFDLTAFFLVEMKGNRRNLEREVHFLAWHYHWSEQAILSMTCKKRWRYIELLRDEIEPMNR